MSQHRFETSHKGFPITVMLGWDRPMQYFFLVIQKPAELVDDASKTPFVDEDFLYSNLHECDPFGHDLDYYRQVLRHFHIVVPESLFHEVENDAARNIGNRVATHQADGSFIEQNC